MRERITARDIEKAGGLARCYARQRPDLPRWTVDVEVTFLQYQTKHAVRVGSTVYASKYARALAGMGLAVLGMR